MSVVAANPGEGITRASTILSSASWSQMCWVKINSLPGAALFQTIFENSDFGAPATFTHLFTFVDGADLEIHLQAGNSTGTTGTFQSGALQLNQWYHVGYVKSGNNHRFYLNGVLIGTVVLNISGAPFTTSVALYNGTGDEGLEIAYYREFDAVLSTAEVVLEMNATAPVNVADLTVDTPLATDLLDDSGNGNDWTDVGGAGFGTSIAIPANASSAGAIEISSLPYSNTQDLSVDGFVFDGWYKHTGTGTYCLGIWGFGNLVDLSWNVTVFESDQTTQFPGVGPINANNIPLQVPFTIGYELYFRYIPSDRTLTPTANLILSALESPDEEPPLGSIVVPDDHDAGGFHLAILSAIDGDDFHVYKFVEFPTSENGDILDNGMILIHDKADNTLHIRNADYTEFMDLGSFVMASTFGCIRQCRGTQRWWVLYLSGGSSYRVRFVEDDGTLGTEHIVASLASSEDPDSLAVNNDETILYYGENTPASRSVKNFDLTTDTLIGTFATGPTGNHAAVDILVLSDDTIVVYWATATLGQDIVVIQYNAAGTVLNTINLGSAFVYPSSIRGRMAYSLDDPDTVWVWVHIDSPAGTSKFMEIELATGSILKTILQQEYEEGEYNSVATETPERFGNSFSCPFWVATTGEPPVTTGTLTVAKISDPFSGTHEFFVDVASGLIPALLTLISDDPGHTYDPVPVGIYSVIEQPDPDWHAVYFVSNDVNNDNLNVSVGAGEDVTVIILNVAQSPGGGTYELTPSGPEGPEPPTDTFINGDGSVTIRGIPPPFIITGFIRDA